MRHFAYLRYLLRHKTRVFVHCVVLGVPLRGALHDLSKRSSVEYFGTGRQFFPSSSEEKERNQQLFQQARDHHSARNQHHFEHWYEEDGSCREIPLAVRREIVGDWASCQGCALSVARVKELAGKCYGSWGKNFRMHPATQKWFLDYLDLNDGTEAGD